MEKGALSNPSHILYQTRVFKSSDQTLSELSEQGMAFGMQQRCHLQPDLCHNTAIRSSVDRRDFLRTFLLQIKSEGGHSFKMTFSRTSCNTLIMDTLHIVLLFACGLHGL